MRTIGTVEVDHGGVGDDESAGNGLLDAIGGPRGDDAAEPNRGHISGIFAQAKAFSVTTMRAKRLVCARVSARVGLGFIE